VVSEQGPGQHGRPVPSGADQRVPASDLVDSHPQSGVRNSQPEGIGRVVAVGELCAWNNLGRNVVFASRAFRPLAIFDETRFPEDDELSQYDLDVHAILELPCADIVVVLNHLGLLRAFRASDIRLAGPVRRLHPLWTCTFAEDVERVVAVGNRLVGSRPREEHAGGVLMSEPILATASRTRVDADTKLETWGAVTALAALPAGGDDCIAVGGEGRVALLSAGNGSVGHARWEVEVGFQPAALIWDGKLVWAAGHGSDATEVGDYEWENLRGGGFAGLDPVNGGTVVEGRFGHDLAWGNGGVAVAITAGVVCGIGRAGELHAFRAHDGRPLTRTAPLTAGSLGIAHAAAVGEYLLYGFNRGGYRLHRFAVSSIARLARARA
jgi:hypothetical protein